MRKNCTTCKHDRLKTPICDECYHTSDAPTKWEPATYYEPDTNADRIRSMSDEELANMVVCPYVKTKWDKCTDDCFACRLEWLKQPAEGE